MNDTADEYLENGEDFSKVEKKWRPVIFGCLLALLYAFVNTVVTFYHGMTGTADELFKDIIAANVGATLPLVLFTSKKTVVSFILAYISILIIAGILFRFVGLVLLLPALVPIVLTSGGIAVIREIYKSGLRQFSKQTYS